MLKKLLGLLLISNLFFIQIESSTIKGSFQIAGGTIAGATALACIECIKKSLELMRSMPLQPSETDKFYFTTACAVILPLGLAAFYAGIVSLVAFNAGLKNIACKKDLQVERP